MISISNLCVSKYYRKQKPGRPQSYLVQTHGIVMVWSLSMIASFDNESLMSTHTHSRADTRTNVVLSSYDEYKLMGKFWTKQCVDMEKWNDGMLLTHLPTCLCQTFQVCNDFPGNKGEFRRISKASFDVLKIC